MRLLAWKVGRAYTRFHVAHFERPLCGTPMPDRVQGLTSRHALPADFAHICSRCLEIAVKAATDEKPADRGEAVDGPNASTGAYCECNHVQSAHEHGEGRCRDCHCDAYRYDPIYEPEQEPV